MLSLQLCLTKPVAADRRRGRRLSLRIAVAGNWSYHVSLHLQSLALNKRHVDLAKLIECRQSPVTGDRPLRVIDACNRHDRVII